MAPSLNRKWNAFGFDGVAGQSAERAGRGLSGVSVRQYWFWLVMLLGAAVAARLPLCWEPLTIRNDGVEYLAVARAIRETGRFSSDLRYHFHADPVTGEPGVALEAGIAADPIRHAAWGDRPPLYPLVAAGYQGLLRSIDPVAAARLGNVLLSALALVLAAYYLRRLFGEVPALLASGYFFLLPHTVYWTAQPMTEALSLALSLAALLAWDRRRHAGALVAGALVAGVFVGLNYLTRPTGGLLLPVLLVDAVRRPSTRRRCLPLLVGFLLPVLPYHLLLWRLYGDPFYTTLGYTFSVRDYYAVTYHGFEATRLTTAQFLLRHGREVPSLILSQGWNHLQSLLLPLLPFVAALPWAGLRWRHWSGRRWSIPVLSLLTFLVHTAVWTAWGSTRYFLLPILLLSGAGFALGWRARRRSLRGRLAWRVVAGVATLALLVSLAQLYQREARHDHGLPALPSVRLAIAQVRGEEVIAADKPAPFNLLLETPVVLLPRTLDVTQLERFVDRYRPEVLVLIPDEPFRAEAKAMAAAWRRGALPVGWKLTDDRDGYLIARRISERAVRAAPRSAAP